VKLEEALTLREDVLSETETACGPGARQHSVLPEGTE